MAYSRTNTPAQRNDNRPATQGSNIPELKNMLGSESVKARFEEVLGKKAAQFTTSIVNVVSGNSMLKRCSSQSVIGAAFVAATYDLPIDSNLGFSAIVPYNNRRFNQQTKRWESVPEAQFQMMYKGFIQLAIRSGCYKKMNYSVVYQDELASYNPITGEVEFVKNFAKCKQRAEGNRDAIVGYYAWFELNTGFRHDLYMSTAEVKNHAIKYSQSYRKDMDENKATSRWSTDFDSMALKTVIKRLLSKWGILSIDMQRAIADDQQVFDDNGDGSYSDNRPDPDEATDPFEQNEVDAVVEPVENVKSEPAQPTHVEQHEQATPSSPQEPVNDYAQFEQDFAKFDDSTLSFNELPFK